ncbi:MAG: hypothetical protein V1901_04085 [Patescibacteria group bacterium]
MNKIKFSHNWNNKLNNNIFTTIRKYTEEKYIYYTKALENNFEIIVGYGIKDVRPIRNFKTAILKSVERRYYEDIPYGLLFTDTGMTSREEIKELFRKFGIILGTEVIILTFVRTSEY